MSIETFEKAVNFLARRPGLLDDTAILAFHCGEPLAVPIDFYRAALERVDRATIGVRKVPVSITTNGTLITQEWCDLIKARGTMPVAVSLDGPAEWHDANRVDRFGRGTHERVMRGIQLLKANDIAFSVLCVLTIESLKRPLELWEFFRDMKPNGIGLLLEERMGKHGVSTLEGEGASALVRTFFETWWRQRERDGCTGIYVRELDDVDRLVSVPRDRPFVRGDNIPLSIVTIRWDGGVSLFSAELQDMKHDRYGDFIVGNVATHSMEEILSSERVRSLYTDIMRGVGRCRNECNYYRACGGGCPANKLSETGRFDVGETANCRLRFKVATDVVLEHRKARGEEMSRSAIRSFIQALPNGAGRW